MQTLHLFDDKPCRAYAAEIVAMEGVESRREALARVPENKRPWVKLYVEDHFTKRKARRAYIRQQAEAVMEHAPEDREDAIHRLSARVRDDVRTLIGEWGINGAQ